jgi:hypothetical protein
MTEEGELKSGFNLPPEVLKNLRKIDLCYIKYNNDSIKADF